LAWGEARFADRLAEERLVRLVALGRHGEALAELEACWRRGGECLPPDARDRAALASTARTLGRHATLERLQKSDLR
ncbi:MAG: hypothetical protein JSR54_03615, partial [Proteobacteria bacterium]|nr:hypothetical protein [Pseudomonadota bacterium]